MARAKLDHAFCLTATCEPGKRRTDYYCSLVTGLVLEVRQSGSKTYIFRYTNEYDKQCQRKIGAYDAITFAQAQKMAKQFRSEVTMGGDPAARKAEKKAVPTYAELAEKHLAFAKSYQRRPGNTDAVLRCHVLPKWGKKRLDEITTPDVATWLSDLRNGGLAPATVEKIRITFNRSFELAIQWQTPGVKQNPVHGIPRPKYNNARDHYLTSEEAAELLKACAASANTQLKHIVGLLLLTGARKRELLDARWEHVNLDRRTWLIPMTKNGKARHIPLSQPALDIIAQLPRFDKCPWLLPNPSTRKPYADIKRPWDTAREAAGLKYLHLHDLRHSAASFMVNAGIDLFTVGKILGHQCVASSSRYSHLANDTLMKAVEAGAEKMISGWTSSTPDTSS